MDLHGRQAIHQQHDKGYKYLLSSKKLFLELLRSFVHREWVERIDESDLTSVDKSYILPDFSGKEADLVYRLRLKEREAILYVLMELQSTVDYQMPYRLLLYQTEIWRDLLKDAGEKAASRKRFKLPAIVPIVLYNGERPWTASLSFRQTIAGQSLFGDELLDFRYVLIDIQRYSEKELLGLSNTIASVFLLEQKADKDLLIDRLQKLLNVMQSTPKELQQRFVVWFANVWNKRIQPESGEAVVSLFATIGNKGVTEVRSNLEKTLDEIINKGYKEGLEQGLQQGLEQGLQQGLQQGLEQANRLTAQKLIGEGMNNAFIARVTGLDEATVESLRRQLQA